MTILRLIFEFFVAGLFAVGGGLATLPFLYEIGQHTGWFTDHDVLSMIAISESTPGPIGINMATYTGCTIAGVLGGIVASLSLVLPSLIVIVIISRFLEKFRDAPLVNSVFSALRPASCALIVAAGLGTAAATFLTGELFSIFSGANILAVVNLPAVGLGVLFFAAILKFKAHPIIYIAVAAVIGIVFKL